MYNLVKQKFQNGNLKECLLATEECILIESNYWHDRYWGMCEDETGKLVGSNYLGKILMQIREELKSNINSFK